MTGSADRVKDGGLGLIELCCEFFEAHVYFHSDVVFGLTTSLASGYVCVWFSSDVDPTLPPHLKKSITKRSAHEGPEGNSHPSCHPRCPPRSVRTLMQFLFECILSHSYLGEGGKEEEGGVRYEDQDKCQGKRRRRQS